MKIISGSVESLFHTVRKIKLKGLGFEEPANCYIQRPGIFTSVKKKLSFNLWKLLRFYVDLDQISKPSLGTGFHEQ